MFEGIYKSLGIALQIVFAANILKLLHFDRITEALGPTSVYTRRRTLITSRH